MLFPVSIFRVLRAKFIRVFDLACIDVLCAHVWPRRKDTFPP